PYWPVPRKLAKWLASAPIVAEMVRRKRRDEWGLASMRRDEVKTPALILDLDVLDANIATLVATAPDFGVGLRPPAKSHKSPDIARRPVAAGALGACCATIAEAEGLAAAGIPGLLVTSPLATDDMLARLGSLLLRRADLCVVADDPRNVER